MQNESSETRILLVSSDEKETLSLAATLKVLNFSCVRVLYSLNEAWLSLSSEPFDIVIINYPVKDRADVAGEGNLCDRYDMNTLDILGNMYCGVILLVKGDNIIADNYNEASSPTDKFGVFTLTKPVSKQMLAQTIKLLIAAREKIRNPENKSQQKHANSEDLRLINRAKFALIQHLRMDEENAHKYIEKQAMNSRKSRREVAEAIIKIYEK